MNQGQCCEGKCAADAEGSVAEGHEYFPSFTAGMSWSDNQKISLWNIPPEVLSLDFDMQCALGHGFVDQLLDMYAINDHTATSDNILPAIIEDMGVKLDGVKVGFLSGIASILVAYAKKERP